MNTNLILGMMNAIDTEPINLCEEIEPDDLKGLPIACFDTFVTIDVEVKEVDE